jgi:YD repeat-containing protein
VCEHQSSPNHAHYWRFLNNVSISGLGTYSLHYNHAVGTYPDFDVSSVYSFYNTEDYYGYGKGAPSGGLLSQIDYPTGGKQTFTYESHQYSKKRQFVVGGLHNVTMETVNTSVQTLSGVRISKIQTYTSPTDLEETKLFSYQPDLFSSFSGSSGIFYDYSLIYFPTNSNEGFLVTDANSYSMLDTHIGYSYVEETTKDAANNTLSKVGYTFDIGKDTYPSDINIHPDYSGNSYDMINRYAIFSGMLTYSNKLANTGHLLAKDYFREDNKIHSELYCYNNIPLSSTHFIPVGRGHLGNTDTVVIFSHRAIPITRKLYVSPDVMEQHVTQEYDEDGIPMHSNRCYLYDNKLRVRTEYLKYSQNEWRFTRYYYPDDYSLVPISPITRQSLYPTSSLRALVGQHRINVPLEIISGYEIPNGDEYITAGKLNLYKTQTVIIGFDSIFTYTYLNKTMDLNVVKPITDYQYLYFHMDSPNYDSRYKLTCSYEFDSSLRPISISPAGKMPTTYTWNGIYPSTKTIGNQVSTYTFIPHVGISSYTNERGITTYYDYDKNGKLVEVYQINDDRKEIINSYQYHIKTE